MLFLLFKFLTLAGKFLGREIEDLGLPGTASIITFLKSPVDRI